MPGKEQRRIQRCINIHTGGEQLTKHYDIIFRNALFTVSSVQFDTPLDSPLKYDCDPFTQTQTQTQTQDDARSFYLYVYFLLPLKWKFSLTG